MVVLKSDTAFPLFAVDSGPHTLVHRTRGHGVFVYDDDDDSKTIVKKRNAHRDVPHASQYSGRVTSVDNAYPVFRTVRRKPDGNADYYSPSRPSPRLAIASKNGKTVVLFKYSITKRPIL